MKFSMNFAIYFALASMSLACGKIDDYSSKKPRETQRQLGSEDLKTSDSADNIDLTSGDGVNQLKDGDRVPMLNKVFKYETKKKSEIKVYAEKTDFTDCYGRKSVLVEYFVKPSSNKDPGMLGAKLALKGGRPTLSKWKAGKFDLTVKITNHGYCLIDHRFAVEIKTQK